MTAAALAGTVPAQGDRVATLDTAANRALLFVFGLLLPILTLQRDYSGTPTDLFSRIAPIDLLCIVFVGALFVVHRMRPVPVGAILFVAAVLLGLVPALLVTPGPTWNVVPQCCGILMAFGFYIVGINVGDSPRLIRWLAAGLVVSVAAEAVIVYHDILATPWFPDPMRGRVRGTFKTNGQLGAFGFCAGAILVTFGATVSAPGWRKACVAAAMLAASFVFLASRRTGMLAVMAWGGLFPVLGFRFAGRRFFNLYLAGVAAALVVLVVHWPQVESSFAGRRFRDAVDNIGKREGFIRDQLHDVVRTADQWFPFGFGVGRGSRIDPNDFFEVHNGLVAVLVELGVLGFAGFAAMTARPLFPRRWQLRSEDHRRLGVLLTTTMVISVLFMFHNTLYRDRTFMLFLGIATAVVRRESAERPPSDLFTPERRNIP